MARITHMDIYVLILKFSAVEKVRPHIVTGKDVDYASGNNEQCAELPEEPSSTPPYKRRLSR